MCRMITGLLVCLLLAVQVNAADLASREQAALGLIHFPWQQLKYEIAFKAPVQVFGP